MKRLLIIALAAESMLFAQEGAPVNQSVGPPPVAYTDLYDYSGANLIYVCKARSVQPNYTATIAATTLTDIVDSGTTGTVTWPNHGLAVGNRVTVAGATVDTDLNGTYYVQTVADANTFTITTASVTDATYTDATLTISTTAPRNVAAIWSIEKLTYSGSNLVSRQWANGNPTMVNICANRATSTGTTKITYQ